MLLRYHAIIYLLIKIDSFTLFLPSPSSVPYTPSNWSARFLPPRFVFHFITSANTHLEALVFLSVCLSDCLSARLCLSMSIGLSLSLYVCISACLSLFLRLCLYLCLTQPLPLMLVSNCIIVFHSLSRPYYPTNRLDIKGHCHVGRLKVIRTPVA